LKNCKFFYKKTEFLQFYINFYEISFFMIEIAQNENHILLKKYFENNSFS